MLCIYNSILEKNKTEKQVCTQMKQGWSWTDNDQRWMMNNMRCISLLHLKTAGSAKWPWVVKEQDAEYSSLSSVLEPRRRRWWTHQHTQEYGKDKFLKKRKKFQKLYLEGHYDVSLCFYRETHTQRNLSQKKKTFQGLLFTLFSKDSGFACAFPEFRTSWGTTHPNAKHQQEAHSKSGLTLYHEWILKDSSHTS